jgi:ZF-HD class homeobox domain-containing protein
MDFDDHDDSDEEMAPMPMPVSSSYDAPPLAAGFGGSGVEPPSGRAKAPAGGLGGGRYRECLKNHAVGIGGHAVDGCGEFMPAGEEGTLDALRCAACGCHRNFHRKEHATAAGSGSSSLVSPAALAAYGSAAPHHHHHFSPYCRTPAGYFHQQPLQMAPPVPVGHTPRPLALPSTSHGWRDDGDGDDDLSGMAGPLSSAVGPLGGMSLGGTTGPSGSGGSRSGSGKKRFRTKFSQEQKDRMLAFAERVGWRVQKHDEAAVQQFCDEVCVKRHVLKVWMHNNKHTLGKKP